MKNRLLCVHEKPLNLEFTFMHLADTFIQCTIQAIHFSNMCVPWELNPQPFALLTQCSTTEPHRDTMHIGRCTLSHCFAISPFPGVISWPPLSMLNLTLCLEVIQ